LANFEEEVILSLSRARLRGEESPVGENRFFVRRTVAGLVEACGGLRISASAVPFGTEKTLGNGGIDVPLDRMK